MGEGCGWVEGGFDREEVEGDWGVQVVKGWEGV